MKRIFSGWLAALVLVLFSPLLLAQTALVIGQDYAVIDPPLDTDNPAKIEVAMFFSFACGHCKELDRQIPAWLKKLPTDTEFKRIPVGFSNPFYQLMARFYYALEAIGEAQRLDHAVFEALHDKGLRLIDEKSIKEWVVAQGVDEKKFHDAFNAFGVISKARRGDQLVQAAKLSGVPTLAVDGRYLVIGKNAKTHADMLALSEKIIDMRRAERKAAKK